MEIGKTTPVLEAHKPKSIVNLRVFNWLLQKPRDNKNDYHVNPYHRSAR
jgi:hypothetical protein